MKKNRFWLGKRRDGGYYELGSTKKYWNPNSGFRDIDYLTMLCQIKMEKLFPGLKLKPGECVEVTINIKRVKERMK